MIMAPEPKYYVYTEQIRGEPRIWAVADREAPHTRFSSRIK